MQFAALLTSQSILSRLSRGFRRCFYLQHFDLPLSLLHRGSIPLLQLLHPLLQLPTPQLCLLLLLVTPSQILLQRKQLNKKTAQRLNTKQQTMSGVWSSQAV